MRVGDREVRVLRELAARWLEQANQPVMGERRRQWQAVKILQAERPMILVETCMLSDYIGQEELVCRSSYLHFRFLEQEGLLYQNIDTWMPCNGSYGFVTDLPPVPEDREVRLKDCWCWTESQESEPVSPAMFAEFFLPYISEVTRYFGLTYYGCCEGLADRFEYVRRAIPNLRAVSVSGWSDPFEMEEMLGKDYVCFCKPTPAYISGANPYWDLLEKDVRDTPAAARDCSLELCYRDIYTINGDRPRLRRWVEMTRALLMG